MRRDAEGHEVTYCYVVEPNAGEDDRETARQWIQKSTRLTNLEGKVDMRLLEGSKPILIRENEIGDENPITCEEY